jgi:hypothetical protein
MTPPPPIDNVPGQPEWVPDDALANLKMERTVNPDEDDNSLTRRLFQQAAPLAAQAIIHVAVHGTNERTKLTAAQYVVDRVCGKPGNDPEMGTSPLERALEELNTFANTTGPSGYNTDTPNN